MYVDNDLFFSTDQDLGSQAIGTANSESYIDTGPLFDGESGATGLKAVVTISESFAGSGATVTFQIEAANETAFDTTNEVIAQTGAIAITALTAGADAVKITIPDGCKRYIRMNYVVATANLTAGIVDSFLVIDRQTND